MRSILGLLNIEDYWCWKQEKEREEFEEEDKKVEKAEIDPAVESASQLALARG